MTKGQDRSLTIAQEAEERIRKSEFRVDPDDDLHVQYRLPKGSGEWRSWNVYKDTYAVEYTLETLRNT